MSDSHGYSKPIVQILNNNPTADFFIHLGDGYREFSRVAEDFTEDYGYDPDKFICVRGNSEFGVQNLPDTLVLPFEGKKVLITHGHKLNVKYGLDTLKSLAVTEKADIVLYGHTHRKNEAFENGIYFLNPGSITEPRGSFPPSYGYVDIVQNGIATGIVKI
jgi:putative phosphoesterase